MDRGQPWRPAQGDFLREGSNQGGLLIRRQLAGQGQHHLVDDAGVLPIRGFLGVKPGAGFAAALACFGEGHPLGHHRQASA
ncbi:hypothetical protein D3C72_2404070 [compost metagenome]